MPAVSPLNLEPAFFVLSGYLLQAIGMLNGPGNQKRMSRVAGISDRSLRNWTQLSQETRHKVYSSIASGFRHEAADPGLRRIFEELAATAGQLTLPPIFELATTVMFGSEGHELLHDLARRLDDLQSELGNGRPFDVAKLATVAKSGVSVAIGLDVERRSGLSKLSDHSLVHAKLVALDATLAFLAALDLEFTPLAAPSYRAYPAFLFLAPVVNEKRPEDAIKNVRIRTFDFMAFGSELKRDRLSRLTLEKVIKNSGDSPNLRNELTNFRAGRGALSFSRLLNLERVFYPEASKKGVGSGGIGFAAAIWESMLTPVINSAPATDRYQVSRGLMSAYLSWWNYFERKERATSANRRGSKPWPKELQVEGVLITS